MKRVQNRASWLAGEAALICDREIRSNLPDTCRNMQVDRVVEAPEFQTPFRNETYAPIFQANEALERLKNNTPLPTRRLHMLLTPRMQDSFRKYTFERSVNAIDEGYKTLLFFPVNLLHLANKERPEATMPLYESLSDIASIYRSKWFHAVVGKSALTANGLWGPMSVTPMTENDIYNPRRPQFPYVLKYEQQTRLSTFDFTLSTTQYLVGSRKTRNERAAFALKHYMEEDNYQTGTTSGCPVNRSQPQLSDESAAMLAEVYNTTIEDIRRPWPESTIIFGLKTLGSYLQRVADADESKNKVL